MIFLHLCPYWKKKSHIVSVVFQNGKGQFLVPGLWQNHTLTAEWYRAASWDTLTPHIQPIIKKS